ncbi:hypothetical protein RHGRI_025999 [Rhododendron griersonianum]|uniref:F-box domain-containing protein n=1 Tax=Rhododendron griersonianum TaxID=479676 RepID=A0AAV6ISI8_9ERIC|nr:hypothetical protein RHGRI_025999 [Rhododendron griersonianum]
MPIGSEMIENKKARHQTTIPTEDSQPSHHLPQEIIFDILSRLPVKHLLRFSGGDDDFVGLSSEQQFSLGGARSRRCSFIKKIPVQHFF